MFKDCWLIQEAKSRSASSVAFSVSSMSSWLSLKCKECHPGCISAKFLLEPGVKLQSQPQGAELELSSPLFFFFFKILFIYLFWLGEKKRERKINVQEKHWLPLTCPQPGTWPATLACTLTGIKPATFCFAGNTQHTESYQSGPAPSSKSTGDQLPAVSPTLTPYDLWVPSLPQMPPPVRTTVVSAVPVMPRPPMASVVRLPPGSVIAPMPPIIHAPRINVVPMPPSAPPIMAPRPPPMIVPTGQCLSCCSASRSSWGPSPEESHGFPV